VKNILQRVFAIWKMNGLKSAEKWLPKRKSRAKDIDLKEKI
jgi:hypothetical protein